MIVKAKLNEWMMMVLLWPFCMKLFLQLMFIQSTLKALEAWAATVERTLEPGDEESL
jgi:hypothetical protein